MALPPIEWYLPALFRLTCDSVAPRKPGQEKAKTSWDCLAWRFQTVVDVGKFDGGRHCGRKELEELGVVERHLLLVSIKTDRRSSGRGEDLGKDRVIPTLQVVSGNSYHISKSDRNIDLRSAILW